MKRRVARILEKDGVDPSAVLAVTFTRVAAEDLHRELVSLGVPGADGLSGRTVHSVAMSILMRNHVLPALGRTPRPLNEYELEPLLADLSDAHGNKWERRRLIRAYSAAWARLQNQEPGYAPTAGEQAFADELVEWLVLHEAMLIEEVIPTLFQYLSANPGAPEYAEYRHVLIDEFQDLNRAEQEVLARLGSQACICIIGDDDQSIYSFKHAHPDGIRQWHLVHTCEDHAIDECRRCPTTIVRMANALIGRNSDREKGRAMVERPANGAGDVIIRQYATAEAEAAAVADKIKRLIQGGAIPGEIIVLAQRETLATPIFDRLRADNIPVKSYYAESALDSIDAQERFAFLKLYLNKEDRVALRWLLGRGHSSWHASAYARILEYVRQHGGSPWTVLERLTSQQIRIRHTGTLVARFREIETQLSSLAEHDGVDAFIEAWLPADQHTQLLAGTVSKCKGDAASVQELYDALYTAITQPEIPLEVAEVRVMSLHKSKGLSSPYVFIVGCVEGLIPSRADQNLTIAERLAKLEEDRRLLYVGITRVKADPSAQKAGYLAITYPKTMPAAEAFRNQISPSRVVNGQAYLHASRFLGEMSPHAPAAQFAVAL
jgi:DNA helicase-2/ATP-dependent DNA helicase PcrA